MNIRILLAKLLDIAFPTLESSARIRIADELAHGRHTPLPAQYDDGILASLNGRALFAYRDTYIRLAIQSLKYEGNAVIAEWFANQSITTITSILHKAATQRLIVVPIPVTFSRHLERGYNQSALLAKAIAHRFPQSLIYDDTVLIRSSFTQSQTKARTRGERAKNIKNAFEVAQSKQIIGRDILIIDDVITTGATIREATRVMRAAGAQSVQCFAVAH